MDNNFTKAERLTKRVEFQNVFENGKVIKNSDIVAYVLLNAKRNSRLGIIVKKRIGNAVKRNRIKRLFREVFRINKCYLSSYIDIIIIPRTRSKEITLLSANEFIKSVIEFLKNDSKINQLFNKNI